MATRLEPSKIYLNWVRRRDKGLGYNISYSRSGDDFNPGIGYERRDNFTRIGDRILYGWYPGEESRLQNHQVFLKGLAFIRNFDGSVESSSIGPGWEFTTRRNSQGTIGLNQYYENVTESFSFSENVDVPVGEYTFYGIEGAYNPLMGNPYTMYTTIVAGSFYDGRRVSLTLQPRANISPHLQLEGTYQFNRVEFSERNQDFNRHIGTLRISAFLNVRHSLITYVQYDSEIDAVITNIRYRFNPREGHDLYIVYDEGLNTDLEREVPSLPRTDNRTLMVKYSYTFNIGI